MDLNAWLVYLAAAIGLSLTPGPNGLLALSHGMRFGLGRATWTALGGVAGFGRGDLRGGAVADEEGLATDQHADLAAEGHF